MPETAKRVSDPERRESLEILYHRDPKTQADKRLLKFF